MAGPFYFAWVEEEETTFGPEHEVEDEIIQSFTIEHAEGANPTLTIAIRNPYVGLLAPGRKTWAWFSVDDGTGVEPIFFGQLVGIPSDILGEVAELVFVARAADHGAQKQALAETLKVPPAYDPIFIDVAVRDDPDTVLEGYSKLWHTDRISLEVSVSDILVGEDGVEEFEDNVPYASVKLQLAQTPLRAVHLDATVSWTQSGSGYVDVFARGPGSGVTIDPRSGSGDEVPDFNLAVKTFNSYTGDGIVSDWPQVGAQLQQGYSVAEGTRALDVKGVAGLGTQSFTYSYLNKSQQHKDGDTLTNNWTVSAPAGVLPGHSGTTLLTAYGHGSYFDPYADPQINIPSDRSATYIYIPVWRVDCTLLLRYDLSLQRIERLKFTLESDLQIITTAASDSDSEHISLQGVDVGLPLFNVLNWIVLAGQTVILGQIVKGVLDDGTISYQIATTAGTAGTIEPIWSDFLGDTVTDGLVVWTSLGTTLFPADVPDWVANDPTPLGQVIHPAANHEYFICTGAGTTGATVPTFNVTVGATTSDNTVTWTSLGTEGAFIGVPIGDASRGVFFPTDRGTRAIEYLLSVARAHQMLRARAVQISWDCLFERALALSCRKNARIYDPRLPGGEALGKIISYSIKGDGPSGQLLGSVTIGCSIGRGNIVEAEDGDPEYVDADVLGPDVQVFFNSVIVLPSDDIGYTRPVDVPSPDDLYFPLTSEQIIVLEEEHFGLPDQEEAISGTNVPVTIDQSSTDTGVYTILGGVENYKRVLQERMRARSVWYELILRPLQGGPIENRYDMEVTTMTAPKMIDLEAGASS